MTVETMASKIAPEFKRIPVLKKAGMLFRNVRSESVFFTDSGLFYFVRNQAFHSGS